MAYYKCGKIFATQNSNTSIETASGAIANFNTSLAMPVLDCIAEFSATQDLHGQSAPYPAGGGKNLFSDVFSDYSKPASYWEYPITLTQGTTYKISAELVGTDITGIAVGIAKGGSKYPYDGQKNVIKTNGTTSSPDAFTIDDTWTDPKLLVYCENETAFNSIFANYHVQLEVGSTATSFAPYSNICPIVGVDKVNITRTGKNLLPSLSSAVTVNQITFSPLSDGAIDIDGTASGNASVDVGRNEGFFLQAGTYYVNITATPYTITVFGIVNGTVTTIKNGGGLFTLTKPTQIFIRVFIASGTTVNHLRLPLQLEVGSTATDYEPYQGTTIIINLGGTYYGGSVDAVTGKITLTYKLVVLDGSEVWSAYVSWNGYYRNIPDMKSGFNQDGLANWLPNYSDGSNPSFRLGVNNNRLYIYQANTIEGVSSASTWKDYLSAHNLEIVYPLAEPITIYASNTAELLTKAGLNNIYCDTGNIEVKYRRINNDL